VADESIQPVLSHYGLSAHTVQIEPLANAGGWSGSAIWRITDPFSHCFCLRRWPVEHPTPERLRLIHSVLGMVSFELPITAVPLRANSGATFVEHAGHSWELTRWLPGKADFHVHPTRPRLKAAMQILARFHLLASRYQRRQAVAPAIVDRQRQWKSLREGLTIIARSLQSPLESAIDLRASKLWALARERLQTIDIQAAFSTTSELWLQPAIRDIHHDHVLFTGEEVTGLIDFGAMRIDTPLTDIARLVGSLVADDSAEREAALEAYHELRPLSAIDRQLINALDESGLVIGALNWLVWLYVERRDMGPTAPVVHRLSELTDRLENRSG
jgi:Ser/Thr protein kinase RdoA (MazF antagonist)